MVNAKLLAELQKYIEENSIKLSISLCESNPTEFDYLCTDARRSDLEDFIEKSRKPSFNQVLFCFIDRIGAPDSDIYKKAGIDRRHFSKIRSNPDYRPGKTTAIALALALELNKKETDKLLGAAGYSLSESETFDLVIQFCLEKRIFNIDDVNQALEYFSLKPLGGALL